MIFGRSNKDSVKCDVCSSKVEEKFSFCPYCGSNLIDKEKEERDFGFLGKKDAPENNLQENNLTFADKMINNVINSVMKNMMKQLKQSDPQVVTELDNAEIRSLPNGLRIKIVPHKNSQNNPAPHKEKLNVINSEQIKKMEKLPRQIAKSSVKRLSNKVVYELLTPGVSSLSDIFISKTESGYEVKAIGNKKVYTNSLSIELPLKSYAISKDKILLEFKAI